VFIFNSLPFNLQRVKKKQAFEKGSRGRPRKYKKVVFFITAGDRWWETASKGTNEGASKKIIWTQP
jgi:hypothetical protein